MQNATATTEDSLAVSYKAKHRLTIWCSNHVPWYFSKWTENLYPHKNQHMNVYSSYTLSAKIGSNQEFFQ